MRYNEVNLVIVTFKMNKLNIQRDLCGHLIATLMSLNVLSFDGGIFVPVFVFLCPAVFLEIRGQPST